MKFVICWLGNCSVFKFYLVYNKLKVGVRKELDDEIKLSFSIVWFFIFLVKSCLYYFFFKFYVLKMSIKMVVKFYKILIFFFMSCF